VAWSKYANGSGDLGPEPAGVGLEESLSGDADGLAGESCGDPVDGLDVSPVDGGDVAVSSGAGPVVLEDSLAGRVVFDLPGDVVAGLLEALVEASASGEERPDIHPPVQGSRSSVVSQRWNTWSWLSRLT
jgi:hypothetical protein